MFSCPNCRSRLDQTQGSHGVFYLCPQCGGRAASIYLLRQELVEGPINTLYRQAREQPATGERLCPSCDGKMAQVTTPVGDKPVTLDVCRTCEFIWFDPKEYESFPALPPPKPEDPLVQEFRRRVALHQVAAALKEHAKEAPPPETWQRAAGYLGLPVAINPRRLKSAPWLTWVLAAVVSLVSVSAFRNLDAFIRAFGFVPKLALRGSGFTLATSFFLHGGWEHLVGNMYFLLIFGEHVEDYLGKLRYALLIALSAVFGCVTLAVWMPESVVPCVGASGGIAGVILFYALAFPNAKIALFRGSWRSAGWFRVSAYAAGLFWAGTQILGAFVGGGPVAYQVHVGGAAMGLLFWLLWRRTAPRLEEAAA